MSPASGILRLLLRFQSNLCQLPELIEWVETEVLQKDRIDGALLELSCVTGMRPDALAKLLRAYAAEQSEDLRQDLLTAMHGLFADGTLSFEQVMSCVAAHSDLFEEMLLEELWVLNMTYRDAVDQGWGDPEDSVEELSELLQQAASTEDAPPTVL